MEAEQWVLDAIASGDVNDRIKYTKGPLPAMVLHQETPERIVPYACQRGDLADILRRYNMDATVITGAPVGWVPVLFVGMSNRAALGFAPDKGAFVISKGGDA